MDATARKAEPEIANSVGNFEGLSLGELAALLGERPHKLERFVEAGIVQSDRNGRFPVERSVASYFDYWRRVIERRRRRAFGETLSGHALRRSLEAER